MIGLASDALTSPEFSPARFGKDDLAAGLGWQAQLEKAINEEATAFAVHVGAKGVVNWVESEVRLGLSRQFTTPLAPTWTAKAVASSLITFSSCACQPMPAARSSLSNHTLSPAARASGLSRSRRFNSRAASVSAPEWLRNRQGGAFGADIGPASPLYIGPLQDIGPLQASEARPIQHQ